MMGDESLNTLLDAVADATRRRVLVALARGGASTATQLSSTFPVTRQAVAKHLQVLLEAGLVVAERRGRETVFAFVPGSLAPLGSWVAELDDEAASRWDDNVAALQRHLAEQRARRGLPAPAHGPVRAAASARRPRPPRA